MHTFAEYLLKKLIDNERIHRPATHHYKNKQKVGECTPPAIYLLKK